MLRSHLLDHLRSKFAASLRKRQQVGKHANGFRAGSITIDRLKHVAKKDSKALHLAPKEFDLLFLLVGNSNRMVTNRQILNAVWGPAHTHNVQYLRVFISHLRQKVEADPTDPALTLTESGLGYRFNGDARCHCSGCDRCVSGECPENAGFYWAQLA